MNMKLSSLLAALVCVTLSGTSHAALQGRDLNGSIDSFEAYYDTDLNITWLADANYALTSRNGYAENGRLTSGAMSWITSHLMVNTLIISDNFNHISYDNWRLPSALNQDGTGTCTGSNCTGSEMGHLFYTELGGVAGQSIHTTHNANYSFFSNIMPSGPDLRPSHYWMTILGGPEGGGGAFNMYTGHQEGRYCCDNLFYVWAVSDGDVGIAAIPEPETYAMMLAGLALVGVAARRRHV